MRTPAETEKLLARALDVIEQQQRQAVAPPPPSPVAVTMTSSSPTDVSNLKVTLANHEFRLDALEERHEKTENKSYSDLQDELKRYKDSQSHWTRYAVTVVVALFTGGLLLWLGKLLGKG